MSFEVMDLFVYGKMKIKRSILAKCNPESLRMQDLHMSFPEY
jgi:hypothetical protein